MPHFYFFEFMVGKVSQKETCDFFRNFVDCIKCILGVLEFGQFMMHKTEIKKVLENTNRLLDTAEFGYKTLTASSPKNRLAGLMNVVVFGRAVTNALQKLRTIEPEFDNWYSKYVA